MISTMEKVRQYGLVDGKDKHTKGNTRMVNTMDVSARFHPNCFSKGATNTLQA